MSNSKTNSKPQPSQTASSEAAAPTTPKRVTPLGLLHQELQDAEPTAPISVSQARVLTAALINLNNVVVRVMDNMDANQDIANRNSENITANFFAMAGAIKQIGEAVGVTVKTALEVAEEAEEDDLKVPDGVTIQ